MFKTVDELIERLQEKEGMYGLKDEFIESFKHLLPLFEENDMVKVAKNIVTTYYETHLEEIFGETMIAEGDKTIVLSEDGDGTRSKSIRVKTDKALGKTKTLKENKIIGRKVGTARDPKLESVYKKRVAVYVSHLREHAKWFLGRDFVEKEIRKYAEIYTAKYNETFATTFALHYSTPKKDWCAWYLAQQLITE